MIDIELLKETKDKFITIFVKVKYSNNKDRSHCYHGTVLQVNSENVIIDEIIFGKQQFNIEDITSFHRTTRYEMLKMEDKMRSVGWKLKSERIDTNTEELRTKLRKLMGIED